MILKESLFCIINLYKKKYTKLWEQIANEFKEYNEYLIFESMNNFYLIDDTATYDYKSLLLFNQAFADKVRNSGNENYDRLLLIAGAENNIDYTFNNLYKLYNDSENKFALIIIYLMNLRRQMVIV